MLRGNCRLFRDSRCAVETAGFEGHTSTASALGVQKERDPPEVWNVAEERSKRSTLSEGLGEAQIVEAPVLWVSLLKRQSSVDLQSCQNWDPFDDRLGERSQY